MLSLLMTLMTALSGPGQPQPPLPELEGQWIMHIYIGQRVFHDELTVTPGPDGVLGGTLTVPGVFSAALENVERRPDGTFSLEIQADEGRGPFRVRYESQMHPDSETFVGFAKITSPSPSFLGGFVGHRPPPAPN